MEQFIINGPTNLKGTVRVSGSKNAALPIIASTILIAGKTRLKNVPKIKDILTLLDIINDLGGVCRFERNTLIIDTTKILRKNPNPDLVKHLRASILLLAPLLVRNHKISFPHPGGCLIGSRPIDIHLKALTKMGANIEEKKNFYKIEASALKPMDIILDFTVTGTENLIMASILTKGKTVIKLAAAEPHVQDLCNFLNKCGAKISGIGTHNLIIEGVEKLHSVEYSIIPDQIESGTFAIAAAASNGDVQIRDFNPDHHDALLSKFQRAGVNYTIDKNMIHIKPIEGLNAFNIRTEVYPGFPTDLQAPIAVLATQCRGTSNIHETIFEGRLGYIGELSKMGAQAAVSDVHHASITGPSKLTGTRITSFDLRAGATLIIAAIIANGESRIDQIEMIDRGYENIEEKFRSLGADIKRVELQEVK